TASLNSFSLDAGIMVRDASVQTCPALKIILDTAISAAFFISESSRITIGDLPPSSKATLLIVLAAFSLIFCPVSPEPVKDTKSISECELMPLPTTSPVPFTILNTPLGTPASSKFYVKIIAATRVSSECFNTTVHPAANALASLVDVWFVGKFQGVINPHTPIGSFNTDEFSLVSSNSNVSKSLAAWRKCSNPML